MEERKLKKMPYAQAKVVCLDNGLVILRSYETNVVYLRPDGWMTIQGLYSATTRRHIGAFVEEYAQISYQTAKYLYEKKMKYNVDTGEIAPI